MKEMAPVIPRYDSSTSAPIPTIMSSIPPNKSDIDSQNTITNTATAGNNKTRAANTSVIVPVTICRARKEFGALPDYDFCGGWPAGSLIIPTVVSQCV